MVSLVQALNWLDNGLQNSMEAKGWEKISRTQSLIMILISAGVQRPTDIAAALNLTRQAIHRTITEMVEANLVRLEPDPNDRRAKILVFDDQTRDKRMDGMAGLEALDALLERRIGSETVAQLKRALSADWGDIYDPVKDKL